MKRIWNIAVFTVAIVYFLLDAIFATIAVPLSRWICAHWAFERIRRWIVSLRPYPTLLLFVVPLVVLEPAKPVAAYLIATGQLVLGLSILAIAEILKLVIVEKLFCISRHKLLSIPAFAWVYGKYLVVKTRLISLEAWQMVSRWSRIAQNRVLRFAAEARGNSRPRYLPMSPITLRRARQRIYARQRT